MLDRREVKRTNDTVRTAQGKVARTPLTRSEIMSRVKSIDTTPEMALRRRLFSAGLRYRVQYRHPQTGTKVDIAFPAARVAVFVDGCFWHGCTTHGSHPKNHADFWEKKIAGNRLRDQRQTEAIRATGWTVIRIWEHTVENDSDDAVETITDALSLAHRNLGRTQAGGRSHNKGPA